MSSSCLIQSNEDTITFRVQGHFGLPLYKLFRDTAKQGGPSKRYVIDLHDTKYMDSSALGMLLLMRDEVGGKEARIEIVRCQPEVRQIFSIANFDKLFRIS